MPHEGDVPAASEERSAAGPWPWYVLVATGLCLTGFFPSLMVSWALYSRGRKRHALMVFGASVVLLGLGTWASLRSLLPWWWVLSLCHVFNLLWSLAVWQLQRRMLGAAPRRYVLAEWRSWLVPVTIGLILGGGAAITLALPTVFGERAMMLASEDTLDRESALWGALDHVGLGLAAGLVLGLWWAGERRRFRARHIVSFVCGLAVTLQAVGMLGVLLMFLLYHDGIPEQAMNAPEWLLVPGWIGGFRRALLDVEKWNVALYLIIPLLFGAPAQIRDFARRALLVPVAFACTIPIDFAGASMWSMLQDRFVHGMSAPDAGKRAAAHGWVEVLLRRFPNQARWPELAEQLARYRYESGEYAQARLIYGEIIERFDSANQWALHVARARSAIGSDSFGRPGDGPVLDIPMVDYESYLTQNWMALLSTIRYWEKDIPESEIKIRLKDISRSDDRILLNPLTNLAELDDAATSLGYSVIIMPTDGARARALVSEGIPVLVQAYGYLVVVNGYDDSRSAVLGYAFRGLSRRVRGEARREAKEILELEEEGHGQSKERLARIRNEAHIESGPWEKARIGHGFPFMAVVCPGDKVDAVSHALDTTRENLRAESDGLLATEIAVSHLTHADPIKALEWAEKGARKTAHPLPLYVGHLAARLWESGRNAVKSVVPLDKQFPELRRPASVFDGKGNAEFLERARRRFESDRDAGVLPSFIVDKDLALLDQSDEDDLATVIRVMQQRASLVPEVQHYWTSLASACERALDLPCRVAALEGAVSANRMDSATKLRLAYAYVLQGTPAKAKEVLQAVDPKQVRLDADYPFCLGAVAESEQDLTSAARRYKQAIAMRTYRAVYHLRLGALLAKQGDVANARKTLEWATKVDAEGAVTTEALRLLETLGSKP